MFADYRPKQNKKLHDAIILVLYKQKPFFFYSVQMKMKHDM